MAQAAGLAGVVTTWLVRQSLWASLVFVVAAVLCWLLKGRAPRLQAALWGLVFLRLVLPVDLAAPWSARSLAARWVSGMGGELPVATEALIPGPAPSPDLIAGFDAPKPWGQVLLLAAWLLGAGLAHGRSGRLRQRYCRWARQARAVEDVELLAEVQRWRGLFGIRRKLTLKTSARAPAAYTMGLLRPVIVLPEEMARCWSPAALEPVLAHELAHVRRCDDLWLSLQGGLRCLFFFHPLVRSAARRLSHCRELICDDLVLAAGRVHPRRYGQSLVAALRQQLPSPQAPGPLLAFGSSATNQRKGSHRMRLLAILHHRSTPKSRAFGYRALALAGALLVLPMAPYRAEAGAKVPSNGLPASDLPLSGLQPSEAGASSGLTMQSPLPGGRLTSAFGPQRNPFSGRVQPHQGVDLAAPTGTPVRAPAAGRVAVARDQPKGRETYGMLVELHHEGGLKTVFAHLSAIGVQEGATVAAGDTLGEVGSSGKSTGSHLHFEVWEQDVARDPASFVKAW